MLLEIGISSQTVLQNLGKDGKFLYLLATQTKLLLVLQCVHWQRAKSKQQKSRLNDKLQRRGPEAAQSCKEYFQLCRESVQAWNQSFLSLECVHAVRSK